jgi:methylated-DNA-[protein]-cysteine S-methyltransferase
MTLEYDEFSSPIGRILFASSAEGLCALDFEGYEARMQTLLTRKYGVIDYRKGPDPLNLKRLLRGYFDGDLDALDSIRVRAGGSTFQELVWTTLRAIPAGQTWTYGQLAAHLQRPEASRAVGHASSLNPVAIVVPCHRLVGASLALTGYAGGLERKQWLLEHEGVPGRQHARLEVGAVSGRAGWNRL